MNIIIFDLEMNQPSGSIIEIGAVVVSLDTKAILSEYRRIINLPDEETLAPDITKLTGITETDLVFSGVDLRTANEEIMQLVDRYDVCYMPVTWGGGDLRALRDQLGIKDDKWVFGRRELDVKTLYQTMMIANGKRFSNGLSRAMAVVGLQFKGTKHRALDDARNTWYMLERLMVPYKIGLPTYISVGVEKASRYRKE